MTPNKQVSPVIRISQGERDASARATHLEAATRKFLVTTNERKQMSTPTNFKRIALVAVAALGLGVLSSVPANAAVSGVTISVTNGATPLAGTSTTKVNSDTGTATGASITVSGLMSGTTDSMTVAFFNKNALSNTAGLRTYLGWMDSTTVNTKVSRNGSAAFTNGAGKLVATVADSSTAGATTFGIYSASDAGNAATTRTAGNVGATFALFIDTNSVVGGAGTYTYQVVVSVSSGNATVTETSAEVSIVVSAPAIAGTTPSAGFTNAFLGNSSPSSADATVLPKLATASTTAAAYVSVYLKNASNTADIAQDTITVSVSGPGLIYDGSSYGKSLSGFQTGTKTYSIVPDGASGVATITISTAITGQSWTKNVTFFAAAAATNTLVASAYHPMLQVGTNASAVRVTAKDAAGNIYAGSIWLSASTAADALVAGSLTTPVLCTYSSSGLRHDCDVTTVAPGTAKMKAINASTVALATATSNEITVTVSNQTAATVKLAFDKATYAPSERAKLTVTVLDSAGKVLPAATYSSLFTIGGITTTSGISGDTLTAVSVTTAAATSSTTQGAGSVYIGTTANAMTYYVFMPAAGGTVTVNATGGTSLPLSGQVAVTASATVTDNAAAALAAVTALATTVASLKTLITTLTNLVLKIQKKVKA